jgi:hypothetical protein
MTTSDNGQGVTQENGLRAGGDGRGIDFAAVAGAETFSYSWFQNVRC